MNPPLSDLLDDISTANVIIIVRVQGVHSSLHFFSEKSIMIWWKKSGLMTKCAVANPYSTFFNPECKSASTSACHGPFQSYLDEPSVLGFRGFHQHQTKWQQSPSYTPAKTSHTAVSIRVFLSRPEEVTSHSSWRASRSWSPKKIPNSNQIFTRGISSRLLLSFCLIYQVSASKIDDCHWHTPLSSNSEVLPSVWPWCDAAKQHMRKEFSFVEKNRNIMSMFKVHFMEILSDAAAFKHCG